jgi:hypothetical protein
MATCRQFWPGQIIRCPAPGRNFECEGPLGRVAPGSVATVCFPAKPHEGLGNNPKCPRCGSEVSVDYREAASANPPT